MKPFASAGPGPTAAAGSSVDGEVVGDGEEAIATAALTARTAAAAPTTRIRSELAPPRRLVAGAGV
jgi:hypothetical protein